MKFLLFLFVMALNFGAIRSAAAKPAFAPCDMTGGSYRIGANKVVGCDFCGTLGINDSKLVTDTGAPLTMPPGMDGTSWPAALLTWMCANMTFPGEGYSFFKEYYPSQNKCQILAKKGSVQSIVAIIGVPASACDIFSPDGLPPPGICDSCKVSENGKTRPLNPLAPVAY